MKAIPTGPPIPRAKTRGRPEIFARAAVVATLIAGASLAPSASASSDDARALSDAQRATHALNRLGYGPRPADIERVAAFGVDRWIQAQLNPQAIAIPPQLEELDRRGSFALTSAQLYEAYGPTAANRTRDGQNDPDAFLKILQRARVVVEDAAAARIARALNSPRQLEETMVEFWFNHFNVFVGRQMVRPYVGLYERDAIRPHALGRFRDLLGATARHPAMLAYLDNWLSTAPGVAVGRSPLAPTGLNENYARELMELHTLGVDGGYTQRDVLELARVFTGWTIDLRPAPAQDAGSRFVFAARRHDDGPKSLFGEAVPGRGIEQGEWALDRLASHPSTARHIATKLARWFVADVPPATLIDRLAATFVTTGGDIRAVLATLFASDEFWDPRHVGRQFKTPYHYVISSLRAAGVSAIDTRPVYGLLAQMGMPIYGRPTPDGFATTEAVWLNSDAIVRRIEFAAIVGAGRLAGATPVDADRLRAAMGPMLGQKTLDVAADSPPVLRAALLLGSPDFMRR